MKNSQKTKTHKMDRHLVSKQKWELEYIVNKMWDEGHVGISKFTVLDAIKSVGTSRRKVYTYLRNNF